MTQLMCKDDNKLTTNIERLPHVCIRTTDIHTDSNAYRLVQNDTAYSASGGGHIRAPRVIQRKAAALMENQLPNDFDLIIIGTGMVESILSAASSRIGKRVLHIDRNDYYGGQWASFNLDAINKLQNNSDTIIPEKILLNENEEAFHIGNKLFSIENFSSCWHIPRSTCDNKETEIKDTSKCEGDSENDELESVPTETGWTQESLLKESRKFNIDLAPKVLQYARGDFVELLISSNIARYSEYRSVSRVLTWLNGQLEVVPCSEIGRVR
ncbi:hypothetical protein NQ318_020721 [Aromia moschata]|uniref:Rab proteins geranylgeranyltransferase component A n=1 Tax=Aromia moschata TaxID=1265417 RepID=A0AAV8YYJ6_9CUCU|nr:hypothetical protein NQ318_020721 [Aromia moschata]